MDKKRAEAELRNFAFGDAEDYIARCFINGGGVGVIRTPTGAVNYYGRGAKSVYAIIAVTSDDPKVEPVVNQASIDKLIELTKLSGDIPLVAYGKDYCKKVKFVNPVSGKRTYAFM